MQSSSTIRYQGCGGKIRACEQHLAHGRPACELARKVDAGVRRARRGQCQVGQAGPPREVAIVGDLTGTLTSSATASDLAGRPGLGPLLVVGSGKTEHEIPFAQEFLKQVDLGHKRIEMNLPEGLLEVNAPLTDDEKRQQRR